MRTRTVVKQIVNLTPEEYKQCYRKNFGRGGWMRDDLVFAKENRTQAVAVMIKDENRNVLGWAIVQKASKGRDVQIFVMPTHRRKGYGTRLLNHCRKFDDKPRVHPHDETSGGFFKAVRPLVRVANHERFWVK